jgi:hypothetical protein
MKLAVAAVSLGLTVNGAHAIDLKTISLKDLLPCRLAAAKYCDRSQGMTMSNLLRCGAVLAANSEAVGNQCRQVLRRYGQI